MLALRLSLFATAIGFLLNSAAAQDRETKVRGDRDLFKTDVRWIYNDLDKAFAEAKKTDRPLLVVMRCIPCEACSQFDKQVIAGSSELNELLKKFVCVRVVQGNALDLSLFQFDYDQSFHALLMNADRTIYGRFGTRSQRPESEDMTQEGFRAALNGALAVHAEYPANRESLRDKTGPKPLVAVPEEFPSLKGKYGSKLDYEGKVVQSCIHCHQIRDAERQVYRDRNEPLPESVLFPYPLPDVIGLQMDPQTSGRVRKVAEESAAAKAGLQNGDEVLRLAGQPILSAADVQWVLHRADDEGSLKARIRRGDQERDLVIALESGWRRKGDLSWRPTTWELRALATGGLRLESLTAEARTAAGIEADKLALFVKHAGQFGRHALAKQAGFQKGDILVAIDGDDRPRTETELLAQTIGLAKGSRVPVTVLREGKRLELRLPTQ